MNLISNTLQSIVNPKIVLSMFRDRIQQDLNKEVTNYSLVYNEPRDKLFFIIEGKPYDYENSTIKSALRSKLINNLEKDCILDTIKIDVDKDDNIDGKLYYIKNGKKEFINFKL